MSKNADSLPGRTERLIPLVRETFGPGMVLYADSNSSYDVPEAIRVGRIMEKYDYGFYEEPCRFDHLEETKAVADALTMPVAGGEQEFSEDGFRWMIANRAVDIVQPDLHYHGGFIRSHPGGPDGPRRRTSVHAAHVGLGPGLSRCGPFRLVHRQSGPLHRVQGERRDPGEQPHLVAGLRARQGPRPPGPGFGITIDPGFVRAATLVKTF